MIRFLLPAFLILGACQNMEGDAGSATATSAECGSGCESACCAEGDVGATSATMESCGSGCDAAAKAACAGGGCDSAKATAAPTAALPLGS